MSLISGLWTMPQARRKILTRWRTTRQWSGTLSAAAESSTKSGMSIRRKPTNKALFFSAYQYNYNKYKRGEPPCLSS